MDSTVDCRLEEKWLCWDLIHNLAIGRQAPWPLGHNFVFEKWLIFMTAFSFMSVIIVYQQLYFYVKIIIFT